MKKKSETNYALLLAAFKSMGIPEPVREFRFHPKRRWRFDLCWPELKLAMEVEGGVWINGRHTRGSGFIKDMEKYNEAVILGYSVLKATPDEAKNGQAALLVERFFKERGKLVLKYQ